MKKKKRIITFAFIITIFVIIYLVTKPKDYELTYKKDGYTITEKYFKKFNMYYFSIKYNNILYEISLENKYVYKKRLIKTVETSKKDNYICVYLKSNILDTYPICSNDSSLIAYSLVKDTFENLYDYKNVKYENTEYVNININAMIPESLAIWNHKGFTFLNKNKNKKIEFLKNEFYYDTSSFIIDKYIIIPNYDEEYNFDTFYVIDMESGKLKNWKLDTQISYNFYYLGVHNSLGYIVDIKNKTEYCINPKKEKLEIVSIDGIGKIWDDGWTEVSMTKLINNNYSFKSTSALNYNIENKKLYLNFYKSKFSILVSEKEVDRIIYVKNDKVYYLVKNELYVYSPQLGEILVAKYSEWEFNEKNSVYIY